ncbi:hypothetical protein [Methylobacterium sp. B4]|uniref:hypothetical protein n=1 Tax=Methylobacterium sp. B4 TaxID=1938755 RepID=UPI0011B4DB7C|nr:hypothetical protein [Methylobacterium sp. B4]
MSRDTWALIGLAAAGSIAVTLANTASSWSGSVCALPARDGGGPLFPGMLGCIEFWLNRYQTTLGAITALIAARVAWRAVQHQVAVSREQTAIAIGDIRPDFWIEPGGRELYSEAPKIVLHIVNNNRRPVDLLGIEILKPQRMALSTHSFNEYVVGRVGAAVASVRNIGIQRRIPGTRPAAPEASKLSLYLNMNIVGRPPVGGVNPHQEQVSIRVRYQVIGTNVGTECVTLRCEAEFRD